LKNKTDLLSYFRNSSKTINFHSENPPFAEKSSKNPFRPVFTRGGSKENRNFAIKGQINKARLIGQDKVWSNKGRNVA